MWRSCFLVVLTLALLPSPVQADGSTTIAYTTALGGDGETDGCPNTATLGLLMALLSPQTGYDWYNLCFGTPTSTRVHIEVVDDSGLPVTASVAVRTTDGEVVSFWLCDGQGIVDLPAGADELSVTLQPVNRPHFPFYPFECPVNVMHGTPTTGTVTVTDL